MRVELLKQKAKAAQGSTGQQQNPIDQTVTGETDSTPKNEELNYAAVMPNEYNQANDTDIENTQEQNINQDNDISTDVNGNNNTVINNQDNSVRQYGGDNRSFVYNSNGGGSGSDMPASMATLAGFYAPDDSPAAQAKFNDMYSTMNATTRSDTLVLLWKRLLSTATLTLVVIRLRLWRMLSGRALNTPSTVLIGRPVTSLVISGTIITSPRIGRCLHLQKQLNLKLEI